MSRCLYQVAWILLSQDIQGFLESVLLDLAMGGQVAAGGGVFDEIVFGKEALGTSVVAGGEMDLGEEKGIFCITCLCESGSYVKSWVSSPTCKSEQFVADVDCGVVLVLVHGILPPFL